jgi:hypothetical protein
VITTPGPITYTIQPGQPEEDTLVTSHQPVMVTAAQVAGDAASGWSLHDSVELTATGIDPDPRTPTSADLQWSLFGPVAPVNGGCTGLDWSAASEVASGTVVVTGDGVWTTQATTVTAPGCYSFGELLVGDQHRAEVLQRPGIEAETVVLSIDPTTTTTTTPSGGGGGIAYTGDRIRLLSLGGLLLALIGVVLLLLRRRARA